MSITQPNAGQISADDGASGSIFTTVQGFITKLMSSAGSSIVGFLQSGSGAVAQTVQTKLSEYLSVFDFMTSAQIADVVAGTIALDVAAAIRAAILAANGKRLFFPAGVYKIGSPIIIDNPVSAICMFGEVSIRNTNFYFTGTGTMLTATNYLDAIEIDDIHFNNGSPTGAIGLQINCVRAKVYRCSSVPVYSWTDAVFSTYQPAAYSYDTIFRDCYLDNTFPNSPLNNTIGIKLGGGASVAVDHCFLTGFNRGVKVVPNGITPILSLSIPNSHFEAFSGTPPNAGGPDAVGIYVDGVYGLSVVGTDFQMAGDGVIAAAGHRAIKLVDCKGGFIGGCDMLGSGFANAMIEIADAAAQDVLIAGNSFRDVDGYGVIASGSGTLTSCEIGTNYHDNVTLGTFNNRMTMGITFGGAAVGVTYFKQLGFWQRNGSHISFSFRVALTSKGSSTGTMSITGLPAAALLTGDESGSSAFACRPLQTLVSGAAIYAEIFEGENTIRMRRADTGGLLTDADLTNDADILVSGEYLMEKP